jgi:L-threonylcarbamoyladenylate synthase
MITKVVKIDENNIDMDAIRKAADILKKGGLVAFPTETVYGLGANGLDAEACRKIYEAKGRPSDNPLILHIGKIEQLSQIVAEVSEDAKKIIKKFWPGPITVIFKKKSIVPDSVSGHFGTVAVRFPSNIIARTLVWESGLPIAGPSANTSGKPSPTKAEHVLHDLNGKIEMIVDGGSCDFGLESTILDMSGEKAALLRPGAVTKEMIEEVIGKIDVDEAVYKKVTGDFVPKAPGMKYKHYSPDADVKLVKGESGKVTKKINELLTEAKNKGLKTGVLATDETKALYDADFVLSAGHRKNEKEIGANLFDILREFDKLGADVVFSETFGYDGEGMAIMNRLNKAAGFECLEV